MLRALLCVVSCLLLSAASPAGADPAPLKAAPKTGSPEGVAQKLPPPAAPKAPSVLSSVTAPPGQCVYVPQNQGLKVCTTLDGRGAFDILVKSKTTLVVSLPEPLTDVSQPRTAAYKEAVSWFAGGSQITLTVDAPKLPDVDMVVVTTAHQSVTLLLRSAETPDLQVFFRDPRPQEQEAEIERRVHDTLEPRLKELEEREQSLEKKAQERATKLILEQLAASSWENPPLDKPRDARTGYVVLHVDSLLRIGARRYLLLVLENLDQSPYFIKGARAWWSGGGPGQDLHLPVHLQREVVSDKGEGRIVLELPPQTRFPKNPRLTVRVETTDPGGAVVLDGIPVK